MNRSRYVSPYRTEEERFDAAIADLEQRSAGVIEPDEPTEFSHDAYMRAFDEAAFGEFSADERKEIRAHLFLGPFAVPEERP